MGRVLRRFMAAASLLGLVGTFNLYNKRSHPASFLISDHEICAKDKKQCLILSLLPPLPYNLSIRAHSSHSSHESTSLRSHSTTATHKRPHLLEADRSDPTSLRPFHPSAVSMGAPLSPKPPLPLITQTPTDPSSSLIPNLNSTNSSWAKNSSTTYHHHHVNSASTLNEVTSQSPTDALSFIQP